MRRSSPLCRTPLRRRKLYRRPPHVPFPAGLHAAVLVLVRDRESITMAENKIEERRRKGREYAKAHYKPRPRPTAEERFWARVEKTETCWLHHGSLGAGGRYPVLKVNGRTVIAHRYSYELQVGPIPAGLELDHLCRNHRCVRPDHLEAVTHAENMRRGIQATKPTCAKGHPLVRKRVSRTCPECHRQASIAYRRRQGATTPGEAGRRMWAARTPEQRADLSRKIWETRHRNAATATA